MNWMWELKFDMWFFIKASTTKAGIHVCPLIINNSAFLCVDHKMLREILRNKKNSVLERRH